MYLLNAAQCSPKAVSVMAASAETEAMAPGLFRSCSNIDMKARQRGARERSPASRSRGGGSMALLTAAEPVRPMDELPPPDVKRWTIRRKAAVVTAVARDVLTREEACRRYRLTEEEFASWERAYQTHGLPGLRSTRIQQYRGPRSRRRRRTDC